MCIGPNENMTLLMRNEPSLYVAPLVFPKSFTPLGFQWLFQHMTNKRTMSVQRNKEKKINKKLNEFHYFREEWNKVAPVQNCIFKNFVYIILWDKLSKKATTHISDFNTMNNCQSAITIKSTMVNKGNMGMVTTSCVISRVKIKL